MVAPARLDERWADNLPVTDDPGSRFSAGAALLAPEGLARGTRCVIAPKLRVSSTPHRAALQGLAPRAVSAQLPLRRVVSAPAPALAKVPVRAGLLPIWAGCKQAVTTQTRGTGRRTVAKRRGTPRRPPAFAPALGRNTAAPATTRKRVARACCAVLLTAPRRASVRTRGPPKLPSPWPGRVALAHVEVGPFPSLGWHLKDYRFTIEGGQSVF